MCWILLVDFYLVHGNQQNTNKFDWNKTQNTVRKDSFFHIMVFIVNSYVHAGICNGNLNHIY